MSARRSDLPSTPKRQFRRKSHSIGEVQSTTESTTSPEFKFVSEASARLDLWAINPVSSSITPFRFIFQLLRPIFTFLLVNFCARRPRAKGVGYFYVALTLRM